MATEFGWLVEDGTGRRYRTMDQMGTHWTEDAFKAIRFARRADAEMFAAGDEDAWRIVEHVFTDGASFVPDPARGFKPEDNFTSHPTPSGDCDHVA